MKCKFTKKIKPFMSFGKIPIANGFLEKNFRKFSMVRCWF